MAERLTAVLASHNRREKTLSCLASLATQAGAEVDVEVVLLDDASTDGTAAAVAAGFPRVRVLTGDGQRFWNGGMRLAMDAAREAHPDLVLWLNDDVVLDRHALATLLVTRATLARRGFDHAIVGGAVRDPLGGGQTYGGVKRRSRLRRLRFDLVPLSSEPVQVETMHGNCVLLPRAVVERVGNLDPAYRHALGDFDYGLRARAAGCSVWMAPGTVGTCPQNPAASPAPGLAAELRRVRGVKVLPPADWRVFARRWAGPAWPAYWASPYLRRAVGALAPRPRPRGAGLAGSGRRERRTT